MARFIISAFADEAGVTLEEQIAALKENGINYIEPRNIGGKGILQIDKEELKYIRSELDKNGIKVGSLGSPIGKYPIDEPFEKHLEDFEKALDSCEILGTTNMRIFSFFIPKGKPVREYREEVIRRLKRMVELASARGIRLCHENEARIYGEYPAEVRDLLDEIPELYGIFDAANYRFANANIMEGIGATLKRLAYLHIKDAIHETKMMVPAGEGEGMIPEALDAVNGHTDGYVILTVEPHLHSFVAYKSIDTRELKGRYSFSTAREAFDFAVNALKGVLARNGYERNGNNEWIK